MTRIDQSPKYKAFVKDRNRALDFILQKSLIRINNGLNELKQICKEIALYHLHVGNLAMSRRPLHERLTQVFDYAAMDIYHAAIKLRSYSYMLAYAGEAEAVGRALRKPMKLNLKRYDLQVMHQKEAPSGGTLNERIRLAMSRLQRKVQDAIERAIIVKAKPDDCLRSIDTAFPRTNTYKRIPRSLKVTPREADREDEDEDMPSVTITQDQIETGQIDRQTWDEMVEEYKDDYITTARGPDDVTRIKMGEDTYEIYDWELEKELTQDFVDNVRRGAVDAANDNGINDFVWIAIIDDRTDDCCDWRDGLTTSEIEQALKGEHKDDECDATVPPAHFNCRCDLAPMTDAMPDDKPLQLGDFETWLTNS